MYIKLPPYKTDFGFWSLKAIAIPKYDAFSANYEFF